MKPVLPPDEAALIHRVTLGDQKAFSELFYRYHHTLGGYIYSITKSYELTEEIVQDTFLKIWQQRQSLVTITSFKAYLFIISKHQTLNVLRSENRKVIQHQQWLKEQIYSKIETSNEQFILLDEAIDQLPTQQRKTWLLSRHEGMKQDDIAKHLQLSRETVKRHLQLATASIVRFIRLKSNSLHFISPFFLLNQFDF